MVICDAGATAGCDGKGKGFSMHYSALTEISTI